MESRQADELTTFNARLPKRTKNVLQRAAELRGQSLSDFVLGSAFERAQTTIRAHELIELSERDSAAFAEALLRAPAISNETVNRFVGVHRKNKR
ncbi:MAG: DUF1778 domain-containing protein [Candidatus Eremiobacteraeota bacterium]|nr:DUF1778 domain-containing protein [Candidatus Eremiobacteraeota bacterium]